MTEAERLESDKNRTQEAKVALDEALEHYVRCVRHEVLSRMAARMAQTEMPVSADLTSGVVR